MVGNQSLDTLTSDIGRYVDKCQFNAHTNVWVVYLGEKPVLSNDRSYGFGRRACDDFFSKFMELSLSYRIERMTFDFACGNVAWVNFYLRKIEPFEETNITIELLEMVAKGWENAPDESDSDQ